LARRQNWVNQLERHAYMQPGATALRFLGNTVTWADLRDRVAALAGALGRRGVGPGDRVMILMLNRTEFVESVLAANMIGAIAVPVNFRLTPSEIAFLVEDCQARMMITEPVLGAVAAGVRGITSVLNTIVVAGENADEGLLAYEDLVDEPGDPARAADVPNESPALIMYTSGTTGRPKGAVLTHTNLTGQTMANLCSHGVAANDVGFIGVPFFHIAGIGNLLTGLLMGLPTVIHPLGAFDPGHLLDVLAAEKVTGIFLVPAQWQAVGDLVGRRAGVRYPAATNVRNLPRVADLGRLRSDRDVAGDLHAARRGRDQEARFGRQGDPDRGGSRGRRRDERCAHRGGR
jgi:fatty-acyl-CoA synthase